MNNKAMMGLCAVVLAVVLAGTYLWIDMGDDDDGYTTSWYATHIETIDGDGNIVIEDHGVGERYLPLTIDKVVDHGFIGHKGGCNVVGFIDGYTIIYEYYTANTCVTAEGLVYDNHMNIVEVVTENGTDELVSLTFYQYTRDGCPAPSMDDNAFDFDMTYTPIECKHFEGDSAMAVETAPLSLVEQTGMIAVFDMEVLGVHCEYLIIGLGYVDDGIYNAVGFGFVNGAVEYCFMEFAAGELVCVFDCTEADGTTYTIYSVYEIPYQEGYRYEFSGFEGTWTGELDTLTTNGHTETVNVTKTIEKVDDNYYICVEDAGVNGIFIWEITTSSGWLDVAVLRTIGGVTESIGFLYGYVYDDTLYLSGVQHSDGYIDGYVAGFELTLSA